MQKRNRSWNFRRLGAQERVKRRRGLHNKRAPIDQRSRPMKTCSYIKYFVLLQNRSRPLNELGIA